MALSLRNLWQRITTTRYARELEREVMHARSEIALLRAENRALLNSILGIAGVPPVPVDRETLEASQSASRAETQKNAVVGAIGSGAARLASPTRRRSWQQINRMLEFESAKKKAPESV
jgi:hypothetical protein